MKLSFSVKSKHFSLYKAFKEECEKIGYVYNSKFSEFSEYNFSINNCLYFSTNFSSNKGVFQFAFSNSDRNVFHLETEWDKTLEYAKKMFDEYINSNIVILNEKYIAYIKNEHVEVGCQIISFDRVEELFYKIKKFKNK